MRERIAKEKGTDDIWDLKQVRGGLVDSSSSPSTCNSSMPPTTPTCSTRTLSSAYRNYRQRATFPTSRRHPDPGRAAVNDLTQILRLCIDRALRPGHRDGRPQGASCEGGWCAELRCARGGATPAPRGRQPLSSTNRRLNTGLLQRSRDGLADPHPFTPKAPIRPFGAAIDGLVGNAGDTGKRSEEFEPCRG